MAESDLPTYRKSVYVVFDIVALGFALEGVPTLIKGEWVKGGVEIGIAIVLIFTGIFVAGRIDRLYKSIKDAQDLKSALSEIEDLKKQVTTPSVIAPPGVQPDDAIPSAPRVLVEFTGANRQRAEMGHLTFISDKRTIVRNVGDLHSAERYESDHQFNLIPSTIPVVDKDKPVQCRMLGLQQRRATSGMYAPTIRSLADILRDGIPQSEDSVVIDYDDEDGNQFSRRFSLTRNQDDSVAWIPDPVVSRGKARIPEPATSDLADLHHQVYLGGKFPETYKAWQACAEKLETEKQRLLRLRTSYSNVILAAKVNLLAEDAERLWDEYNSLMEANQIDPSPIDLSHPLSREVIYKDSSEDSAPLPWQRLRLMFFREHYNRHHAQVTSMALTGFNSGLMMNRLPNELREADVTGLLKGHRTALLHKAAELADPYFEALNAEN